MKCKCGCGKEITPKIWHKYYPHNFCKGHRSSPKLKTIECAYCHKEIQKRFPKCFSHLKHHFCSRQCSANFKKSLNIKTCFYCKTKFHRRGKSKYKRVFCSTKCLGLFHRGKNNPVWKTKVLKRCRLCRKKFKVLPYNKHRVFCSVKCFSKWISLNLRGSKAPNWRGGISSQITLRCSSKEWHKIRNFIYKRDNWTCQKCGIYRKDKNGNALTVHHIEPYRISKNHNLKNLITLCRPCHLKEEWTKQGFQKRQKLKLDSNKTDNGTPYELIVSTTRANP